MEVPRALEQKRTAAATAFAILLPVLAIKAGERYTEKSRLEPDQKLDLDQTAVLSESGLCGQLKLNIVYCERVEERDPWGLEWTQSGQLITACQIEPLSFMGTAYNSFGDFHGQRPANGLLTAKIS